MSAAVDLQKKKRRSTVWVSIRHPFIPPGRHAKARVIVAENLGRWLTRDEHVHHIDGDFTHDDPSNLVLMLAKDHHSLHSKGSKKPRNGLPAWNRGIPHSQQTRDKISKARKGKKWTEEQWLRKQQELLDYMDKNPSTDSSGSPWENLGVSRRTWYRRRKLQLKEG